MPDLPEFDMQDIIDGRDTSPYMRLWAAQEAAKIVRAKPAAFGATKPADIEEVAQIVILAEWLLTGEYLAFDDWLDEAQASPTGDVKDSPATVGD